MAKISKEFLILDSSGDDWTDKNMINNNVDVYSIYSKIGVVGRVLRKLYFKFDFPYKYLWYGNWKNFLKDYQCIIIFSALLEKDIFEYIRKNLPDCKLIFYYRDPMSNTLYNPDDLKKLQANIDIWTFDDNDAIQYKIKYNPQFYFYNKYPPVKIEYDAVFIGHAKMRIGHIMHIKREMEKQKLELKFHVIPSKNTQYTEEEMQQMTFQFLDYEMILNINRAAKSIVEINQEGQSGMSVRALEAIFMKKKLITNNVSIKKYDFYNPQNIFIIGIDNMNNIKKFLETPYNNIDEEIISYYAYDEWLKRFICHA